MALCVHTVFSPNELKLFLQGAIKGAQLQNYNGKLGLMDLVGETVSFASPGARVPFVAGSSGDSFLTAAEIKTQIEAALRGAVLVGFDNGYLYIKSSVPTVGVSIGSAGQEPGRTKLGFDGAPGAYTTGKVYAAPDSTKLPRLVSVVPSSVQEKLIVITEE